MAFFRFKEAAESTYRVGAYVADRIDKWGLDTSKVTVIGHSLGAQICGEIGRILREKGKTLGRIFGEFKFFFFH